MAQEEFGGLAEAIVGFCRFVRANGLPGGVKESLSALEAARAVGPGERETFKAALRAVLCSSKADWELFDELFGAFWYARESGTRMFGSRDKRRGQDTVQAQPDQGSMTLPSQGSMATDDQGGKAVLGASEQDRLQRADFSEIAPADMADLERIALRLLRQMSLRLSRKLTATRRRGKVDLRRTIRLSISRGGDPIYLSFRGRKLQQQRLVILLDISGSMNPYSVFLVRFAYALQKYFKRVDTFLFSTRLTDITVSLRTRHLQDALEALAEHAVGWAGGTRIGDSIHELRVQHGKLLSRNTVFMILSDGWETGEPERLAAELSEIKRRVSKVVWLNPLLGMKGYEPITRGMTAALPYIDVFAPAHNLQSLLELEGHLSRA